MTVTSPTLSRQRAAGGLLALLLLLCSAGAALAQEGEWHYTVRDNESLQEIADRLLAPTRTTDQLRRHNSLSSTRLEAGDRIQIPIHWLDQQPRPAKVLSVTNEATVRPHLERRFAPMTADTTLNVGDTVRTADGGRVVIELADGTRIQLGPDSRLTFDRLTQYGRTGMADTRLRLERGRIRTRVQPVENGDSRFEVETPSAVAAVRGTQFDLSTDNEGTRLAVTEGQVWFGDGNDTQMIPTGYGATRSATGEQQVRPLSEAPTLEAAATEVTELPLSLAWEAQSPAQRYEVDLFAKTTNEWLLSEQIRSERISLQQLNNGEYRLELAAIDAQGMRSKPETLEFSIDLNARAARLLSPNEGERIQKDEAQFSWAFEGNNEQARVEIARDRDFNDIVARSNWSDSDSARISHTLEPGDYYWRVETRAGGTSQAHSDVVPFTLTGTLNQTRVISVNQIEEYVRVFWQQVENSDHYELQLARDASFEEVVSERIATGANAELDLEPGEPYYVRIRGQADGPYDTDWGPSYQLKLE